MYKGCFNGDFHCVTTKNTQNRMESATDISKRMLFINITNPDLKSKRYL